ncbi:MAG: efflux RND transporter periplasmic adaptor subunit [Pseudomonadales bacterium]
MKLTIFTSSGFRGALIVVTLFLLQACSSEEQSASSQSQPMDVNVVRLQPEDITLKSTLVGRVSSIRSAEIRPQVSGIILKRYFEEGSQVESGQSLYQIDPAIYEANLANAKGQLAVAKANEHAAELRASRLRKLVASGTVSQQDFDDAEAVWLQAQANRQAAEAAVKSAQINLDYTQIKAPISGVISRSMVTEGALVSAQQAQVLATIRQLSPIYVDVQRPAKELLAMKQQANGSAATEVSLELENGSQYEEVGYLKFSESSVDAGTGTVTTRTEFPNVNGLLLPGMFVRATLASGEVEGAILAPQRGITLGADGNASALVVGENNMVEARNLILGEAIGDKWLVSEGLGAGDQLIISGLQKIQPDMPVNPSEVVMTSSATDANSTAQE